MANRVVCQKRINSAKSAPVPLRKVLNSVLNVQTFPVKLLNKDQLTLAIASIYPVEFINVN